MMGRGGFFLGERVGLTVFILVAVAVPSLRTWKLC